MKSCLVIMNPRDIRVVKRAVADLPIAKLWLTGYTERELAESVFSWAINEADYDQFLVMSDDIIVRPYALEAVLGALDGGCEVATGYSQRSHTEWVVNVTAGPLRESRPSVSAYDFREFREIVSWPEPLVPTWFTGMSLTGMSKEMWQQFPFGCFTDGTTDPGYASDFHLSKRLQDARVPIYAVREAFCYHWRTNWERVGESDDPLLVGEISPSVTLQDSLGVVA